MYKVIIIIFLVGLTACNNHPKSESAQLVDSHEHTGESSQYTLYSEQLEFFMEHLPLVAGEETEFLVHITDLATYKPTSAGNVSILIDGVSVTSGEPSPPGIFHVPFSPKKGGAFHAEISYKEGSLKESVEAHIPVYADHDAIHAPNEDSQEHTHPAAQLGEITFLKEQAWQSDFRVEKAAMGPFHTVIPTSGELMPMPGEKKNIPSTTRGMVHFADPQLVQGAHVQQGQLLFTISSESLVEDNIQLKYEATKNRLEKSRSEYKRHEQLYKSEAISERQYIESRAIYTEDSLNFYNLDSHISEEGIRVVAPSSGSLHELAVSDGLYVTEGTTLAILSPDRNLMLRADLPQQYFQYSQSITTANFRPAYSTEVLSVKQLEGKLLAVGHSVKENDHYLPVNFLLKNDGSLLEGAFAKVYLIAGVRENVLSIPATALGEEQGGKYLFVQVSGETFSKRRVETGPGDGHRVEIKSGLAEGERVVTRGAMLIKAASMESGEISDGHSH